MAQYRIPVEETFSWQRPIIDKDLATPPVSPAKGDRYIVAASPTGDWVGHANHIAWCSNATGPVWSFDVPAEGWQVWVNDEDKNYAYTGAAWTLEDVTHAQQHAITSTVDHTSTATAGKMLKADANGLPVDATNTDAEVSGAVSASHTQGTDTALGTMAEDIVMGSHQITGLAVPVASGDAIRATAVITEASLVDAVNKAHTSGSETLAGDVSGTVGASVVDTVGGKTDTEVATAVDRMGSWDAGLGAILMTI